MGQQGYGRGNGSGWRQLVHMVLEAFHYPSQVRQYQVMIPISIWAFSVGCRRIRRGFRFIDGNIFIYGFLALKWEFVDDFYNIISGRIGKHRFPRPTAWELVIITGKTAFFTWALVIPLFFHPLHVVIFYYAIGVLVLGITLSVVFQLPHCVEEAEFPVPREDTEQIERPWAVHQAYVTVDYDRRNPVLSWFFGGLNFHKEHHLFPTICHIHYPAITKIVEETCRDHGIKYSEHKSFRAGIAAHYRWLQKMGKASNQN